MFYCNERERKVQPNLAGKSYSYLRKKLTNGELPAGTQLVNRMLAKEIGVSLAPVREAINRLSEEGLVRHVPGAGAFVREFSRKDLEEIYIVREAIEGCAAAEAARNISLREIEELEEICQQWRELVHAIRRQPDQMATPELVSAWSEMDEHFHEVLVSASHNKLIKKMVSESRLFSKIFKATQKIPELTSLKSAVWTWRDHVALVHAIKKRDPERARELMVKQIIKGRQIVLGHFKKGKSW